MSMRPGSRARFGPTGARLALFVALIGVGCLSPAVGTAASWSGTRLPGPAEKVFLLGVSCPSSGLCVAVGTDNVIASSTNPTGGAPAWHYGYAGEGPWPHTEDWPTEFISGRQIQAISCPTSGLCVAVTDQGFIYSTTNPTGPAGAWRSVQIDDGHGRNTHLFGVSCPTAGFCVAVSGKRADKGKILTTDDPTGPASAWSEIELGDEFEFRAVSCPSASLCVIVDNEGRILASTDPRGGPSAWRTLGAPAGQSPLRSVDCLAAPLCLSGNHSGDLLVSTRPTVTAGWSAFNGGGSVQVTGVSCASAGQCLAVDNNGDVISSTDPTGGSSAWTFTNVQPFTGQEGNALFGASCPSASLCALVGSRGKILTSDDAFASDPPTSPRRGRHRVKRPRVRIATVLLPSRRQLEHHRGRLTIRFYARARTRRFLCRLDHRRLRRCRSPKRYHVGPGHHVFRVRAVGYSGLRGPLTARRVNVHPLCGAFPGRSLRRLDRVCS
jgi:hypothetical protein